jgi:hypothetical protein
MLIDPGAAEVSKPQTAPKPHGKPQRHPSGMRSDRADRYCQSVESAIAAFSGCKNRCFELRAKEFDQVA